MATASSPYPPLSYRDFCGDYQRGICYSLGCKKIHATRRAMWTAIKAEQDGSLVDGDILEQRKQ